MLKPAKSAISYKNKQQAVACFRLSLHLLNKVINN